MKGWLNSRVAMAPALIAAVVASLLPTVGRAQSEVAANWVQSAAQGPSARAGVSLSYDSSRRQTVLFGGAAGSTYISDTWLYSGTAWTQVQAPGPSERYLAPMVFDSLRGVSVLFGGYGYPGWLQDTWEWDGSAWAPRFTAHRPPSRDWSAMTYDSRRHLVVLFGGTGSAGLLNDTWEYNGSDWTQVATVHAPPVRRGHELAFDSVRGKTVMFGGQADVNLNDTWEYDGTDWMQTAVTASPSPRLWYSMAYDAALGRTVLFGGTGSAGLLNDSWLYDGASWQQFTPTNQPSARFWAPVVYDSVHAELVLFGGTPDTTLSPVYADTWSLRGIQASPGSWAQATPSATPAARVFAAMDYDSSRGVTVLFGGGTGGSGGFQDTWEWDGFNWLPRSPQTSPPALSAAAMAYDTARRVSVLFGGSPSSGSSNSSATWEWDGANWRQRALSSSPPARVWPAMAYDSARGRIVMFGGSGATGQLSDTWEFDGNTWTQLNPAGSPSPRYGAAAAFDPTRNRTVLFGGQGSGGRMADTWEWDGTSWTQVATPTAPYARLWSAMAFDSQRSKLVLFGGDHIQPYALGSTNDTWEWDGSQWSRVWTDAAPAPRAGQTMAYDAGRGRAVVFGGDNAATSPATFFNDTWEFGGGIMTPAGSPAATITPSTMDFGSVDLGTTSSAAAAFILSSGTGPLVTTTSTSGDFAISSTDCPNAPNPLAAGTTCLTFVTFSPTAAGDRFGNLILTGNVPGGAQSVPLHGVGIARDFSISANPTSIRMVVGGPNPTSAVSTTVIGAAGTVALSALTTDPGVTATFSPPSIAAGTGSTMTIAVASSLAPGYYGVRVVGDEGAVTHYVDVSLQITPVPDFSMTANPNSSTIAQGSRAAATVTTTATGPVGNVDLSASVTPAGPTAVLSPSTVVAGGVSTLTVSVGYGVAPGRYTVTVAGVEGSISHSTTVIVTVTLKGIVNAGFETGDLTGWNQTGVAATVRYPHSGLFAGQIGSSSASSTSTLAQTFTVPATGGKLTFWYRTICSDKAKNDWFTVSLLDGVTGASSTLVAPVCSNGQDWTKVTVNLSAHAGHFVTLTFLNHDDGVPSTPTFTLVDDVSLT
ncbi:MAG: hypothetical protein E6H99_08320 [Chloroflexi bacterium]|nr:MAG: hypothetical protein E6H99_08320 [Chloroflexota bacterium]